MRAVVLLVTLAVAGTAAAGPIAFRIQGDVALGEKPKLEVTANEQVTNLQIDLARDDGKKFKLAHRGLAKGQTVTLAVGDGAAGKATYTCKISLQTTAGKWTEDLTFDTSVRAPIKVTYDAAHLDLEKRVLQFKVSRPIAKADLVVLGDDGSELAKNSATYTETATDKWLSITWTQAANTNVMMLKLRVTASDGAGQSVELIPWSVVVEHEDVNFRTDSSEIDPAETKKLDASLVKIQEVVKKSERFVKMRLYIAGHTDTVGPGAKNRTLSSARALAIAKYFRKQGLALPIAFAGYGEDVLKVKTADNTDEAANRRADYVIGPAVGTPPFKGPYLKARADWKQLP